MDIDNNAFMRLERQLERAISDSLIYLNRYSAAKLVKIDAKIEEKLNTVDDWETENYSSDYAVPNIEKLRFLEPNYGHFHVSTITGKKQFDLYPIFALFRAVEGKGLLDKENDYVGAAECCADAFEALYSVLSIPAVAKINNLSLRGKKAKQAAINDNNDYRETIVCELNSIIENDITEMKIKDIFDMKKKVAETRIYYFKKKNGNWHFSKLAQYIYDKLVEIPRAKCKNSIINFGFDAILETVTLRLKDNEKLLAKMKHNIVSEAGSC